MAAHDIGLTKYGGSYPWRGLSECRTVTGGSVGSKDILSGPSKRNCTGGNNAFQGDGVKRHRRKKSLVLLWLFLTVQA